MSAGQIIRTAGLGDALVATATSSIQVALDPTNLNAQITAHPVVTAILARDEAMGNILGALGVQMSFVNLGQSKMAATSEGAAPSLTTMLVSNISLTPARYAMARNATDWARTHLEPLLNGSIAPNVYALMVFDALRAWINTIVNMICALATSATGSAGTSGGRLTFAALTDMVTDMQAGGGVGGSGLILMLLDAKGVKDLQSDILALGGAAALAPQMQQFLSRAPNSGYIGRILDCVDIYLCPELDTDSGDTLGIAFTEEGVQTKHQLVSLPAEAIPVISAGFVTVEANRGSGTGATTFTTTTHVSAGIRQQQGIRKVVYATT